MNIFDYKKKCLIHNEPLHAFEASGLILDKTENGLSVSLVKTDSFRQNKSKFLTLNFYLDGTYSGNEDVLKYLGPKLAAYMKCLKCNDILYEDIEKTSISNIGFNLHSYSFELEIKPEKKYGVTFLLESIKYVENDRFYHVISDLQSKETKFYIGSCKNNIPLHMILDQLIIIDVPSFNMGKIENLDQFLNKMKLYTVFS